LQVPLDGRESTEAQKKEKKKKRKKKKKKKKNKQRGSFYLGKEERGLIGQKKKANG